MSVFRIHIRPSGGSADLQTTFDYCLHHGILGVGWRIASNRSTKDWDEYYAQASQELDKLQVCSYIKKYVRSGDLVWTRDPSGQYFLARVLSGWEYWITQQSQQLDIDIANIFRCELKHVRIDDVPGKIVADFRGRRAIQAVTNTQAREYSKHLWNILSGRPVYSIDKARYCDIFMLLDDQETEDLVFLYLQSQGWYVLPNSRKRDTMSFEFVCVNPINGEIAGSQVKTGEAAINMQDYAHLDCKTFLFQPNGRYVGAEAENVESIPRDKLLEFLQKSRSWLPGALRHKMEIAEQ